MTGKETGPLTFVIPTEGAPATERRDLTNTTPPGYDVPMDPALQRDLITVSLCILGSGLFSASETALTSLPVTRLERLRTEGGRLTRAGLNRWADSPRELLITILVGNNLVNVVASAIASRIAFRLTGEGGLAIAIGVMTLAILIIGEITPKTLAQQHAEWISARVAGPLYLLDLVLRPVNSVLGLLSRWLTRGTKPDVPVTEKDLLFMLHLAHHHAQLPPDSRHMIESVLRFQQAVAREVMVARPQVMTLDRSWSFDQVLTVVSDAGHSRFPLVDGSPDAIIGIVHAKSLLGLADPKSWPSQAVPALFIPETKSLPELLQEFRTSGQHMAIILDEFGGSAGIVTLEDAIELVVGEIRDEFDPDGIPDLLETDSGWSVAGHVSLRRLERVLHKRFKLPEDLLSVGGLVAEMSPDKPTVGTVLLWQDLELIVTEMEDGRPSRVMVVERRETEKLRAES